MVSKITLKSLGPHLALFAANLCWGMMSPVTKSIMLNGDLGAIPLTAIRIGGGAILFLLLVMILPQSVAPREKLRRVDILPVFLASILIISANQGLYILGIAYTNPIDSAVMCSLTPMLTMLLAALLLQFPITAAKAGGVLIGLVGVTILIRSDATPAAQAPNVLLGDTLCLAAQLCAALYYVLFRGLIQRYHPFTLMKWMFIFSALTFVPFSIPKLMEIQFSSLGSSTWLGIAYIIVFATVLAYLTLPYAQRSLKPTAVSIYSYFQPVAAAIMAVALGVGMLSWLKCTAMLLIFAGVYFVNSLPHRKVT